MFPHVKQELFGAIGDMKKARLVKPGTAEVIYKEKSDAQMAVKKYNQRELDGLFVLLCLLCLSIIKLSQDTVAYLHLSF